MAFDYGLRRIGVAVGNCLLGTTTPLSVLPAKDGVPDWSVLKRLVDEWTPDLLVVGEPLNMDGSPSELSAQASRFARRLHGRLGIAVVSVDERLSSFEAEQRLLDMDLSRAKRKERLDALAAADILQTFLDQKAGR